MNDETLKEQIELRLEAMYFASLKVKNLDTGETEPPQELEEAINVHLPRVMQLILQDRERARIDELKQLWNDTQPDIVPEGAKANDMSERLHDRIAELQSSCNKREDSDE